MFVLRVAAVNKYKFLDFEPLFLVGGPTVLLYVSKFVKTVH